MNKPSLFVVATEKSRLDIISLRMIFVLMLFIVVGCKSLFPHSKINPKNKVIKSIKSYEWRAPNHWHGERVFYSDTILFEFDTLGRHITSKILYHAHNDHNWSYDSTYYSYQKSDSVAIETCYSTSKKGGINIETTQFIRDSLNRLIEKVFQHSRNDFYNHTIYFEYDKTRRFCSVYKEKLDKQKFLLKTIEYHKTDSTKTKTITVYKRNGIPSYKTIDATSYNQDSTIIMASHQTIIIAKSKREKRKSSDRIWYYYKNKNGQTIKEIELNTSRDTLSTSEYFYSKKGKLTRVITMSSEAGYMSQNAEIYITSIHYNQYGNWIHKTTRKDSIITQLNTRKYTYWK